MGKQILLLVLGLCLLVSSLHALTCVKCERFNSQGICEQGEGCCQAKPGQKCASLVTYKDGKFLLGSQRCADVCFRGTVENGGLTAKMKCCSKTSFCNTVNL